jgi:cellulose synthase/poly-beta-1,6-N-acetylglucosamine synthase-like glycosyltransferase
MIHIIISSYNEPKSTLEAIKRIKEQEFSDEYKIILSDPFPEIKRMMKEKHPDVKVILDLGEGKSAALNRIMKKIYSENTNDLIILTDGDVFLEPGAVKAMVDQFKDEKVGIVCGHPISMNKKTNKFGYWSHLLFAEMNRTRRIANRRKQFFELSGYLFGIRNGVVKQFPKGASEDNVIPTLFYNKGYRIGYAEGARVLVLNPQNMKDWVIQKKRNIKGHMSLGSQVRTTKKRTNTFLGESKRGIKFVGRYGKTPKDFYYISQLMLARLYVWGLAYNDVYLKGKKYHDGWRVEETKSTSPLDN